MAMRWTAHEDAQLSRLLDAGLTYGQIMHCMVDRSKAGIIRRARRIGK